MEHVPRSWRKFGSTECSSLIRSSYAIAVALAAVTPAAASVIMPVGCPVPVPVVAAVFRVRPIRSPRALANNISRSNIESSSSAIGVLIHLLCIS